VRAHHVFTDRSGGVSGPPYDTFNLGGHVGDEPAAVAENRRRLAARCGLERPQLLFMRQVHGAEVAVADGPWAGDHLPETDALVTSRARVALAVLVADCTPVLLADETTGVVGAAHAGRGGLAKGIVPATLDRMLTFGAKPERITAWVGPAVCGRCYEVPPALQEAVSAAVPSARSTTRWATPGLDIPRGVQAQLRDRGVSRIERVERCTVEDRQLFSYRRDGTTGRLAGVIWLEG